MSPTARAANTTSSGDGSMFNTLSHTGLAARATKIGARLADGAYMAWQFAQIECSIALLAWHAAGPARSAAAHLAYCAALDREEAAARDFEELCRVTSAFATA
jgi:hypothetical protein